MMWLFRKTVSLKDCGFFKVFTDYHSHILPGVDDGVKTLEESLELLEYYAEIGIKEVWFTPHIMEDSPNTTEHLQETYHKLLTAYHGSVTLHLGAEYMLDNLFGERLEKDDLLPLSGKSEYLLVETSYFNPPVSMYDMLEQIKAKGYYSLLAHPERYDYMDEEDYRKLKRKGVKFQLNLSSVTGLYGEVVRKKSEWLLKNNLYDCTGTDVHEISRLKTSMEIKLKTASIYIQRIGLI